MSQSMKTLLESPWLRVINVMLMLIISIIGGAIIRAETNLKDDIEENKGRILNNEIQINNLENTQLQNSVTLEYIKSTLEEIKSDVKEIKRK